jgi:hypothetical protein
MRLSPVLAALTILAGVAGSATAQADRQALVRVTARDSSGLPISDAEVTLSRGLKDVVARASTDGFGRASFPVTVKDSSDFQVSVRKIGYKRGDRFFGVGPRDTAVVNVVAARVPAANIDAVKITAKRENKYNSYDLLADEIESSEKFMDNAWEVVKALRPVMLTSRGGCATGAQEVWVNGKRIRLPLRPTGMVAARAMVNAPLRTRVSYVPISVLSDIAPEHIAEIHYHDCFDSSMAAVGNNDAIFVTLKPGVVYVQDVGSFVVSRADEEKKP